MKNEISAFESMPPEEFDVSDRIHVRLFDHGDEKNLLNLISDEPVKRFVPWASGIENEESAARKIAEFKSAWERGVMARYAVELDGSFVGYAGLWPDKDAGYYEFGFAVQLEYRGQGIGTNSVKKIIDIAKNQLGAEGMIAYVHDENEASKAIVGSLGFVGTDEFDDGDRRHVLEF